jgi:5-formyltetrahydrofolate cyclo-ligase
LRRSALFPLLGWAAMAYSGGVKSELRKRIKDLLAGLPAEEVRRKSDLACQRLLAQEEYRGAKRIMAYVPLPAEADAAPIARAAWRDGKTVAVPKIDWDTETMSAAKVTTLDNHMVVGRHGVRSPEDGKLVAPEKIDLIVAPALAIDRQGNRLGRGGGYYDRFLAQPHLKAIICALVFGEQLLEELPHFWHDRPVHMVVTDEEVLRFSRGRQAEP